MLAVTDYQIQRILANIIQNQDKVKYIELTEEKALWCMTESVVTFRVMLPAKEVVKE